MTLFNLKYKDKLILEKLSKIYLMLEKISGPNPH
jgi:hypothetical protein